MGIGVIGTGLLVLASTGDWLLASLLFLLGRIGFTGSIVFYDALLPHIARDEGRDNVSARGYAIGYLGGATKVSFTQVKVLPPIRQSNLGIILGLILALEAVGILFAWLVGKALFTDLDNSLDTKRSIILALIIYSIVAVWGFFLNSTIEFWSLAWMVAIVQGGS